MTPTYVLIHSPLVGPLTWRLVADELERLGYSVVVPTLTTDPQGDHPYWRQHVAAVVDALHAVRDRPVVLVGHSGAGPLLPAIGQSAGITVSTYLFVDSDIPRPDASRLDLFASLAEADTFRATAVNGLLPTWTEDDLRAAIPDPALRRRFVADLRPTPLAVYEEPLPCSQDWPDAPCGYVHLSAAYTEAARHARREGWGYYRLNGGHFHMLVYPGALVDALLCLGQDLVALAA